MRGWDAHAQRTAGAYTHPHPVPALHAPLPRSNPGGGRGRRTYHRFRKPLVGKIRFGHTLIANVLVVACVNLSGDGCTPSKRVCHWNALISKESSAGL